MVQTRRNKNLKKGVTTRGGKSLEVPKEAERPEVDEEKSAAPIKVNKQMICRLE